MKLDTCRLADTLSARTSLGDFVVYQVKLMFTIFAVVVGIVVYFIDPKANIAGPDWFWRLGKYDPFRNLLCRPNGTFRRYTKLGILLWFALCLSIIWVLVPTK